MLVLVAAGFLCCWIPIWVFVLWFRFFPETNSRIVELLVTFLFYLSASINPIIYAFTNSKFRREFRKLLCCHRERTRIVPKKAAAFTGNDLVDKMSNLELPSRSLSVVIIEASICVALNITSLIGNSLVCIAAYRNLNLRSTTNLYIIALAVSDLLVATIEMPLTSSTLIVGKWDFGN
ncbi:hypothetical protein pdam_00021185, partial [Pocillopora damicornis]